MSGLLDELVMAGPMRPLRERELAKIVQAFAAQLGVVLEPMLAQYAQPLVEPVAGHVGYHELIAGVNPTAGASFRFRIPGEYALRLLSVLATLTTSAVAGSRSLTLEYQDSEDVRYLVAGAPVTLPASQAQTFCWHPLAGDVAWPVEDAAIAPLPQQFLYPTSSLLIKIGNVQAGDQLSSIRLVVEKVKTDW